MPLDKFPPGQQSLTSYQPTWRDRAAMTMRRMMGAGDKMMSPEEERLVSGVTGATGAGEERGTPFDFLPGAAAVTQGADAVQSASRGNYPSAAMHVLNGFAPAGIKAGVHGVGKAIGMGETAMTRVLPHLHPAQEDDFHDIWNNIDNLRGYPTTAAQRAAETKEAMALRKMVAPDVGAGRPTASAAPPGQTQMPNRFSQALDPDMGSDVGPDMEMPSAPGVNSMHATVPEDFPVGELGDPRNPDPDWLLSKDTLRMPQDALDSFSRGTKNAAGGPVRSAAGGLSGRAEGGPPDDGPTLEDYPPLANFEPFNDQGEIRGNTYPESRSPARVQFEHPESRPMEYLYPAEEQAAPAFGTEGLGLMAKGAGIGARALSGAIRGAPEVAAPATAGLGLTSTAIGAGEPQGTSPEQPMGSPLQVQIDQLVARQKEISELQAKVRGDIETEEHGGNGKTAGKGHDYHAAQDQFNTLGEEYQKNQKALADLNMRASPEYAHQFSQVLDAEQAGKDIVSNARKPFEEAFPTVAKYWWMVPGALAATTIGGKAAYSGSVDRAFANRWRGAVDAAEAPGASAATRTAAVQKAQQYAKRFPEPSLGSAAKDWGTAVGVGGVEGGATANAPEFYNYNLPYDNPEYKAYQEELKRLPSGPVGDPERERVQALLQTTPPEYPAKKAAEEHFGDFGPQARVWSKAKAGAGEGMAGAFAGKTGAMPFGPLERSLPRAETDALTQRYPVSPPKGSPAPAGPTGTPPRLPGPGPAPAPAALPKPPAALAGPKPASAPDTPTAKAAPNAPSPTPAPKAAPTPAPTSSGPPGLLKERAGWRWWTHKDGSVSVRPAAGRPDAGKFSAGPPKKTKTSKSSNGATPVPDDAPQMDENGNWIKPDNKPEPNSSGDFKRGGAIGRLLNKARSYATGGMVVGPVVGPTGGRADEIPVTVPKDAYVVPAYAVSYLGGGNSEAGFKNLQGMFPEGQDGVSPGVPIRISHGEFVISPAAVARIGGGSVDIGNKALDQWVLGIKKQAADELSSLPGPAQ